MFKQILHIQIFIKFYNKMYWRLKLLIFSPALSVMQKVQKVESVNIEGDCKITCKKRTDWSSALTHREKVQKAGQR